MDLWAEVAPGCNVWYITRELYSSACLCISNRGILPVVVEVDLSEIRNVRVLSDGVEGRNLVARVSPQRTDMICGFVAQDEAQPMALEFHLRLVRPTSVAERLELGSVDDQTYASAKQQSLEIESWLKLRRR